MDQLHTCGCNDNYNYHSMLKGNSHYICFENKLLIVKDMHDQFRHFSISFFFTTHPSCETLLGGTCVLIGCIQGWLELDRESNQKGRRWVRWMTVLDPIMKNRKVAVLTYMHTFLYTYIYIYLFVI